VPTTKRPTIPLPASWIRGRRGGGATSMAGRYEEWWCQGGGDTSPRAWSVGSVSSAPPARLAAGTARWRGSRRPRSPAAWCQHAGGRLPGSGRLVNPE
jgi:hypothetical protein